MVKDEHESLVSFENEPQPWGSRPPVERERPNRAWTAGHGESLLPYRGRPATRPLASRGSTLRGSAFGCVQRAPGKGHSTGDRVDQPPTPSHRRAPSASSLDRVSVIRNLPSQDRKKRRPPPRREGVDRFRSRWHADTYPTSRSRRHRLLLQPIPAEEGESRRGLATAHGGREFDHAAVG